MTHQTWVKLNRTLIPISNVDLIQIMRIGEMVLLS
jgi:hypothetical protein